MTGRVEVSSTTEPAEEVPYHAAEELPKSVSSIEKPTNVEFNEKDVSPRSVFVVFMFILLKLGNPFDEWPLLCF